VVTPNIGGHISTSQDFTLVLPTIDDGSPIRYERPTANVPLGQRTARAWRSAETVVPRVNQKNLAQIPGLTRLQVSHYMSKFRKLGFVDYSANSGLTVQSGLPSVVLHD
jgi:hypothetical protein